MWRKIVTLIALSAFLVSIVPSVCFSQEAALQDVVYLKNGSIIRGIIIEQIPGQSLKIRIADGSVFVYQMSDVERITKEKPVTSVPTKVRKEPVVACALSIFLPGAGQLYNGEVAKGVIMFGAFIIGASLMMAALTEEIVDWNYEKESHPDLALGTLILLGAWLWSVIDAPISASRINRENGWASLPLIDDDLAVKLAGLSIDGKTAPAIALKWSF